MKFSLKTFMESVEQTHISEDATQQLQIKPLTGATSISDPKTKATVTTTDPATIAAAKSGKLQISQEMNETDDDVGEGKKTDRMVKHITKSERDSGKSKDEAENIAWATANKRGMLNNKNKKTNEGVEMVDRDKLYEGSIEELQHSHPFEHKQFMEGWGLDESLYEALADHYHREGRIPRKVWNGPLEELRGWVEECYSKDMGMILGEDGLVDEAHTQYDNDLNPEDYAEEPSFLSKVGSSLKAGADKALNVLGHGSDDELLADLEAETGGMRPNRFNEGTEMKDIQMEGWEKQLSALLTEGITVSTSMGQEQAPDSVSVSATDDDAHTLLKIIHDAGLGVKTDAKEELLKAHGMGAEGGMFSVAGDEAGDSDVEVVDFDTAQGGLEGEEDDGDAMLDRLKAMLGIGKDAAPEPKHPEGFDGEEGNDEEEGDSESEEDKEQVVDEEWSQDKADEDYDKDGEVESEKEEHEGAVGNAIDKEDKDEVDESDFDQKDAEEPMGQDDGEDEEEPVKESHENCNECGLAEAECGCEENELGEAQLNEWANSREGAKEDEEFQAELDFLIKGISGGLNNQKQDQTVMPSTRVKVSESKDNSNVIDFSDIKKLAGIK